MSDKGHRTDERCEPRRALARLGAAGLSEAELLAVLLQRGPRAAEALDLSLRLLEGFGGLRPLLAAAPGALLSTEGLGRVRAGTLLVVPEIARRYFEASLVVGETLGNPADTEAYLRARLRDREHEVFCCLFLDNRHRVLRFAELFRGTIDGTSVYPREVVKEALAENAAAVILAHNHPSGVAEPSQADERITRRLKSALELVDIRLLDHLIVGDGVATSLASRGLL